MTAKTMHLGADVAALGARSSKLRDPSVSHSTRRQMSYTPPSEPSGRQSIRAFYAAQPPVGSGRRAWRDLPGITPPQIRERR